jgi:hypothetical protein
MCWNTVMSLYGTSFFVITWPETGMNNNTTLNMPQISVFNMG